MGKACLTRNTWWTFENPLVITIWCIAVGEYQFYIPMRYEQAMGVPRWLVFFCYSYFPLYKLLHPLYLSRFTTRLIVLELLLKRYVAGRSKRGSIHYFTLEAAHWMVPSKTANLTWKQMHVTY